jgi:hypothetical protein
MRRICVYCGSSPGARPGYRQAAEELGRVLAGRGIGLVYGGGNVGLMGAVADAVLAAGGQVTGVIPRALEAREVAHTGLDDLRVVGSMHERKALMADLADAFVALPGGVGTLEELVEVMTWTQLGVHAKPCGLLDAEGFYDHLLAFLDHAVQERFLRAEHRALLVHARSAPELLDAFAAWEPPALDKWIDRGQT